MNNSVDERIVEMKIENKNLIDGVRTSQEALNKLNGAVDNVGKNSRGFDGLSNAADVVHHKFSALNVMALTLAGTITNKLVNVGLKLARAVFIDPIKDGFKNYEEQINAAKTVLANTQQAGTKLKDVTKSFSELNKYAQLTIYNFGQMTQAVSQFTASGVGLKAATAAVQGIANLGAMSGSSAEHVQQAYTQMGQALQSGFVKLQDWRSFVNEGLATPSFQHALALTAVHMGTLGQSALALKGKMQNVMIGGQAFQQSLQSHAGKTWLTSGEFAKTLDILSGKFTKAQLMSEGYSAAQAKYLAGLGKTAYLAATQVKTVTQLMSALKEEVAASFGRMFVPLLGRLPIATRALSAVHNALDNFQAAAFQKVTNMLWTWVNLGGRRALFNGIGQAWKDLGLIFKAIGKAWKEAFPGDGHAMGALLAMITKGFDNLMIKLQPSKKTLSEITTVFKGLFDIIGIVGAAIGGSFKVVLGIIKSLGEAAFPGSKGILALVAAAFKMVDAFAKVTDLKGKIEDVFKVIGFIQSIHGTVLSAVASTLGAIIKSLGTLLSGNVSGFVSQFKGAFVNLKPVTGLIQTATGAIQHFFDYLSSKAGGIVGKVSGKISNLAGTIGGFAGGIGDSLSSLSMPSLPDLSGGAAAVGGAGADVKSAGTKTASIISDIGQKIWDAVKTVGDALGAFMDKVFHWLGKVNKVDILTVLGNIFSGAIVVMAFQFVKKLGGAIQAFSKIGNNVGETFEQLSKSLKSMQQQVKAKIILDVAIAVGILAGSIWLLSKIPAKNLGLALGAVSALIAEVMGSLLILSKKMGDKADGFTKLPMIAGSLILMASAVAILAVAMKEFAKLSWEDMAKGFAGVAVGLGLLVAAAMGLSAAGPSVILSAAAMVILSVALLELLVAVKLYEKISWKTLLTGIAKILVVLVPLAAAMALMGQVAPAILVSSVALGVLSVTLTMLLGTILLFAQVKWSTLLKGIAEIAVALAAIGVASAIAAPGVALLGAAVLVLGTGMLAAGAGMAMFGAGLTAVAAAGMASIAVLVAGIGVLGAALPTLGIAFAKGFALFLDVIAKESPKITNDLVKIVGNGLSAMERLIPKFRQFATTVIDNLVRVILHGIPKYGAVYMKLVNEGLKILRKEIPKFVNTGMDILQGLLNGIRKHLPKLLSTAGDIVVEFITGIGNNDDKIITAGTNVLIRFIRGLGRNAGRLAAAAGQTILNTLQALDAAVTQYAEPIGAEGRQIAWHLATGLANGLLGGDVMSLINAAVDKLTSFLPGWMKKVLGIASPSKVTTQIGKWVTLGYANGIAHKSVMSKVTDSSKNLAQHSIDTVKKTLDTHSPSKVFQEIGMNVGQGFTNGILASIKMVAAAGRIMANEAIDTVSKTISETQQKIDALRAKGEAESAAAADLRAKARSKGTSKSRRKALDDEAKHLDNLAALDKQKSSKLSKQRQQEQAAESAKQKFDNADAQGKADILNNRAQSLARQAEIDRQNALKLAHEADLIRKNDAKRAAELEKQAKAAMVASERAATAAKHNAAEAVQWSVKAATNAAQKLQDQIDADLISTKSPAEQLKYWQDIAKTQQAKSDAQYAAAEALIEKARNEAKTNAGQAKKDLAKANADVAAAEAAKQLADNATSQIQQLSQSSGSSGGTSTNLSMPVVDISSSQVFGAQNMFEAYAKALQATADQIAADKVPSVVFNQTNTSPTALSTADIYRQSQSLLANTARQLTGG